MEQTYNFENYNCLTAMHNKDCPLRASINMIAIKHRSTNALWQDAL